MKMMMIMFHTVSLIIYIECPDVGDLGDANVSYSEEPH